MRYPLVFVVSLSAAIAHASYDLMYIGDSTATRVHRFDPVSRTYLGSFSAANSRYVAAHAASPHVVAASSSVVGVYDGSGNFVNAASAFGTAASITPAGTMLAISGATTFREVSLPNATTIVSNTFSGITDLKGIVAVGSNRFAVGRGAGGNLVLNCYNTSGSTLLSSTTVALNANLAAQITTTGLGITTSTSGVVQLWFTYRSAANAIVLNRYSVSGTTTTISDTLSLTDFSTLGADTTQCVMGGHGNSVFVVGADATNVALTRIVHYGAVSSSTTEIASYTTGAFSVSSTTSWMGANVVAPEPGSMLALGAGALVLLRRRR